MLHPRFSADLARFCDWLGEHATETADAFWKAAPTGPTPTPADFRAFQVSELRTFLESELAGEAKSEFLAQFALLLLLDAAYRRERWVKGVPKFVRREGRWRYANPLRLWFETADLRLPSDTDLRTTLQGCSERLYLPEHAARGHQYALDGIASNSSWQKFVRHQDLSVSNREFRRQLELLLDERQKEKSAREREHRAAREAAERTRRLEDRKLKLGARTQRRPASGLARLSSWLQPRSSRSAAVLKALDAREVGENALWYPSSGNDVRDVLEFGPWHRERHGFDEVPSIYIHTDPSLERSQRQFTVISDDWSGGQVAGRPSADITIDILEEIELELAVPDPFVTEPSDMESFLMDKFEHTSAVLRQLAVRGSCIPIATPWVLHVGMTNLEFFGGVVMPGLVVPRSVAKIRSGSGCGGGCLCCPSAFYRFLSAVGCQRAILDGEVNSWPEAPWHALLAERWASLGRAKPEAFQLEPCGSPFRWSAYSACAYRVVRDEHLAADGFIDSVFARVQEITMREE